MEAAAIAQLLLFALEVYRNHHGKDATWIPTDEDWAALRAEVVASTIEKLHADAADRAASPQIRNL